MHINEHILLAVQIIFYQYETCISFHRQLTWLKMKLSNAIRICVRECIFDPQRVLLRILGSYHCRVNQNTFVQLREKWQKSMAAKPHPLCQQIPCLITGHEMVEIALGFRVDVP